jgi:hypothetical protein
MHNINVMPHVPHPRIMKNLNKIKEIIDGFIGNKKLISNVKTN